MKTNRIILAVGITSFIVFLIGIFLLIQSKNTPDEYQDPVFNDNDDALNIGAANPLDNDIVFNNIEEGELPITTTPNPVPMGQVVLGTTALNVLTIGTNGKAAVKITGVQLAEPPADGFSFHDGCTNVDLNGERACHITMEWTPIVAGNVQNNFIITWYETNLGKSNSKSAKVPVIGNAIDKTDCNFCENVSPGSPEKTTYTNVREAVGPDGSIIGMIDEDGYVRDKNGNVIGRVNGDGLIVFGKYRGHFLHEILKIDPSYLSWIAYKFTPKIPKQERFVKIAQAYHSIHLDIMQRKSREKRSSSRYLGELGEKLTDLKLKVTRVRLEDDPYKTRVNGTTPQFFVKQILTLTDASGNLAVMSIPSKNPSAVSCTLSGIEHEYRLGEIIYIESAKVSRRYESYGSKYTRLSHVKFANLNV